MVHSGMDDDAMQMARTIIARFEEADVETVIINSAGCGSTMKEYGYLLRDDPEWADRAARFSAKCRDISEVLSTLDSRAVRHPLPMKVAYHDACHLRHAQGIFAEPRMLLASIPGLEVLEITEPDMCCGSAGVYNLLHPLTANQLGDRKVSNLLASGGDAIVSANPGCLLQLMSGLRRRGLAEMPTFHMVELLDASIRGISPKSLLQERGFPADSS
jgi:glycolate oxidase iron-sulfur subunit